MKLRLGPAGHVGKGPIETLKNLKELGLEAEEFALTHSIWIKPEVAKRVKQENKKYKIKLSAHAPYYINLSSKEKEKVMASKRRILRVCYLMHLMGGGNVVFHGGYYQARDKEEVYQMVKREVIDMKNTLKEKAWTKAKLCLETTGKPSQFGNIDELLRLRKEIKTSICVDFAHIRARSNGKIDYDVLLKKIKKAKIKDLHCHFSGIEYGPKGERRHLIMEEKEIKQLLEKLKKHNVNCTIISESPITYEDSLKMKRVWEKFKDLGIK